MTQILTRLLFLFFVVFFINGCSAGLTPDLRTGLELAGDGRSLIAKNDTFSVKVSVYDQYINIGTNDVFVSFLITVKNLSKKPQHIPKSSFYLLDQNRRQYQPYSTQQLMALVQSRYSYLLPYPFVGYYYSDSEAFPVFSNTQANPEPFRLLKTSNQFDSMILPGANVEGILYFPVDTSTLQSVQLQIFPSDGLTSSTPEFSFPFSVEK